MILPGNHDGLLFGIFNHDLLTDYLNGDVLEWQRGCRSIDEDDDVAADADGRGPALNKRMFIQKYIECLAAGPGTHLRFAVARQSEGAEDIQLSWVNPNAGRFCREGRRQPGVRPQLRHLLHRAEAPPAACTGRAAPGDHRGHRHQPAQRGGRRSQHARRRKPGRHGAGARRPGADHRGLCRGGAARRRARDLRGPPQLAAARHGIPQPAGQDHGAGGPPPGLPVRPHARGLVGDAPPRQPQPARAQRELARRLADRLPAGRLRLRSRGQPDQGQRGADAHAPVAAAERPASFSMPGCSRPARRWMFPSNASPAAITPPS